MEDINHEIVSNKRFYLSPHSITVTLFEKELEEKGICFHCDYLTIRQAYIVYSFYEKDIPTVIDIYDRLMIKIQKQEDETDKQKKEQRKARRRTNEYRQKKIAVWLIVLICIIIVMSIAMN